MSYVWINGRLVLENKARIPVFDSAYLYGQGIFETLRADRTKVLFLEDHLRRLKRNARRLGLHLRTPIHRLRREVYRSLKKNKLKEATLRMMLSESASGRPQLVILAKPYSPFPRSFYQHGAKLILVRSVQNDSATIASVKTTNYLTKMLARKEIEKKRAVDGILLNSEGKVTEGASSNVFVVKRGRLFTPPVSNGLLPGIRRAVVIDLARRLQIPVKEKSLLPKDLKNADEIFLTSSLKGIMPIREFEGKKIGQICPGPVTKRLIDVYRDY